MNKKLELYSFVKDYDSAINFLASCRGIKEQEVRNLYPRVFDYFKIQEGESWKSYLYRARNNIKEIPRCKYCGDYVAFTGSCFGKTCSKKECKSLHIKGIWNNKTPEEKARKAEKFKQSCLEKYGVDNPNKCRQVREKLEQTNLERYGVKYSTQADEAKRKKEDTLLKKYGNKVATKTQTVKDKTKQTCIEKYGVENPNQSKEARQSTLERYGVENYNWVGMPERTINILSTYDNFKSYLIENRGMTAIEMAADLEVTSETINKRARKYKLSKYILRSGASTSEKELRSFISSVYNGEIILNSRSIIPPKEIDIYLPELKLAFEFNGSYWHSLIKVENKGGYLYHQNKSLRCLEKGIKLIHIYEKDWTKNKKEVKNKIKDIIQDKINIPDDSIIIEDIDWGINSYPGYRIKEIIEPEIKYDQIYDSGKVIYEKI